MSLLRLATRNLWRAPRRTALTTVSIVAGVGVFIVGEGFLSGMDENIIVAAIDGTVGHVQARPLHYPTQVSERPVDRLLEITGPVRSLLDQEAVAWTERTYLAPIAAHGRDSLRLVAIGYDPLRDPRVFPRDLWQIEGTMPSEGRVIAVGPRVARLLDLELGSDLVLQVRTHQGAINALEVKVGAIVITGNPALDFLGIFVPHSLAAELINSEQATHLSVKLSGRDQAPAFAERLQAAFAGQAEVVTWQSETSELLEIQQIRRRALDLIMVVLMALAAFGIANTILMAAHERVREIGTLRSMGMTEGGVVRLFLLEGGLIGLVGSVVGALWGGGLTYYWSKAPLDFSEAMSRGGGAFSASTLIYTHLSPQVLGLTLGLGILISLLSSIFPARVASRLSPAEAVRAS